MSANKAFQDYFPDGMCYGCGSANEQGLQIKSHWDGDEAVCTWQPEPHHTSGIPNALYGGMAACLIDCHGLGTVIAAAYRAEGREIGSEPVLGFVTGSLQVRYLKPTPMGGPLTLRARVKELTERKCVVACSIYANGEECVRGEVVGVRVAFNPFAAIDSAK